MFYLTQRRREAENAESFGVWGVRQNAKGLN